MDSSIPKYVLGVVLGLAAGLFLGAVLWAKAAPRQAEVPQVLRAQRFEVVDKAGKTLGVFGVDELKIHVDRGPHGDGLIFPTSKNVTEEVVGITMMNQNGSCGLTLGQRGGPLLLMDNPKTNRQIQIALPPHSAPVIGWEDNGWHTVSLEQEKQEVSPYLRR